MTWSSHSSISDLDRPSETRRGWGYGRSIVSDDTSSSYTVEGEETESVGSQSPELPTRGNRSGRDERPGRTFGHDLDVEMMSVEDLEDEWDDSDAHGRLEPMKPAGVRFFDAYHPQTVPFGLQGGFLFSHEEPRRHSEDGDVEMVPIEDLEEMGSERQGRYEVGYQSMEIE